MKVQVFNLRVRVNGDEGTPVPIPNTVVKLINGDNTWLATAREDNTTRTQTKDDRKIVLFVIYGFEQMVQTFFIFING